MSNLIRRNSSPFSLSPFNLFSDDFFRPLIPETQNFKVNIQENDNAYLLTAELPGYDKENLQVSIKDGVVTVSAEKSEEKSVEKPQYVHRESYTGKVSRQIYFENIDEANAEAKYENGILALKIPKKASTVDNTIDIQ